MLFYTKRRMSGFTLVELAIVLGVAGLLFGGLWRLLSNGNQQMRDQATANQQSQLIGAISTFLLTAPGQSFMANMAGGANIALPLPTANAAGTNGCSATDLATVKVNGITITNYSNLCTILPAGFSSTTTPNPYGQYYTVRVLKDSTAAPQAPQTYSFMILTTGGTTIPDTSGGRISAMIGGDGGFDYASAPCAADACGAFGAWQVASSTYFTPAATTLAAGHVASRTYYSPYQNSSSNSLARIFMLGDSATSPVYNTMNTAFFLGGYSQYFGSNSAIATGGGIMNVQGGTINMAAPGATTGGGTINVQGGSINLGTDGQLTGTAATGESLVNLTTNGSTTNSLVNLAGGCTSDQNATTGYVVGCVAALQIASGDIKITNGVIISPLGFSYAGSDIRLKKNVQSLTDPLTDIMKLKPVSFVYKLNGKKSMGVIAQDLEQVYPQLITKEGAEGMRAVAYEGLIAPLIGSIQELKHENDDMRVQLREQAAHQEKLEQDMDRLRQK